MPQLALARSPDTIHELFEALVNQANLEHIVSLYESSAAFVERDGKIISGSVAIAEHLRGLLAIKPQMRIQRLNTIYVGDVAVLRIAFQTAGVLMISFAAKQTGRGGLSSIIHGV